MNPRVEALAFRIWAYAEPRGWDCTAGEVADALGETPGLIGRIVAKKGWAGRLRANATNSDPMNTSYRMQDVSSEIGGLAARGAE